MPDQNTQGKFSLKKEKIRRIFHNIAEDVRDIFDERRSYIQMRLPVENVTDEFEKSLTDKIEHSIVQADIRIASEKDIEQIMKIYDSAWHTTSMPIRNVSKDTFIKLHKEQNTKFLVARVNSTDVGFILVDLEGENKNIGVIGGLGVLKNYQHKGVGTMLGLAAWRYFKMNHPNVLELRCEVYKENLISYNFIKGLGFEEFHPIESSGFLMK